MREREKIEDSFGKAGPPIEGGYSHPGASITHGQGAILLEVLLDIRELLISILEVSK